MEDLFAKVCPVCKKTFSVTYPSLWAYKIGTTYYCRYNCWRVPQKKGESMKRSTITLEQKKKAVQIALEGGDPLTYLEGLGANSPTQTWFGIKKKLKASNPELFEKLPKRIRKKNDEPEVSLADAMKGMKDAADEFFGACEDMGLTLDKEPAETVFTVAPPEPVDVLPVCGVRSRVLPDRKFLIDSDSGEMYLDYDGAWVKLSAGEWKALSREILTALAQLGVEQ